MYMVNNIFCTSCGQKNTFEFEKPRFCNHCGVPFSVVAKVTTPAPKNARPVRRFRDEEEDEDLYRAEFPTKMEVEIASIGSIFRPASEVLSEPPSGLSGRDKPTKKVNSKNWWKEMSKRLVSSEEMNIGGEE
jgi:hypothetical protein